MLIIITPACHAARGLVALDRGGLGLHLPVTHNIVYIEIKSR